MAVAYFGEDDLSIPGWASSPSTAASTSQGAAMVAAVGCMDPESPSYSADYETPCSGTIRCHSQPTGLLTDTYENALTKNNRGCCDPREEDCEQPEGNRCPTLVSMEEEVMSPCNNGCCMEPPPPTCANINADGSNQPYDCGAHTHDLSGNPDAITCNRVSGCRSELCCTLPPPVRTTARDCPEGILHGQVTLSRTMDSYSDLDNCWVYIDLPDGMVQPNGRMDADEPRDQLSADGSYTIDLLTCDRLEYVRDDHHRTDAIRLASSADPNPCDPANDAGCRLNVECDEGGKICSHFSAGLNCACCSCAHILTRARAASHSDDTADDRRRWVNCTKQAGTRGDRGPESAGRRAQFSVRVRQPEDELHSPRQYLRERPTA
jgi:hypothetical protein